MFALRPTTIGTPEDHSNSGLFLCSNYMNLERISNLTTTKEGKLYIKITNRNKWIAYHRKNLRSVNITETQKKNIQWVIETRVTCAQVQALIDDMGGEHLTHRTNNVHLSSQRLYKSYS
jgi:hypothetical protein